MSWKLVYPICMAKESFVVISISAYPSDVWSKQVMEAIYHSNGTDSEGAGLPVIYTCPPALKVPVAPQTTLRRYVVYFPVPSVGVSHVSV